MVDLVGIEPTMLSLNPMPVWNAHSEQRNHLFARYSGTFVPYAMPPWCHCICIATGALCSAAD